MINSGQGLSEIYSHLAVNGSYIEFHGCLCCCKHRIGKILVGNVSRAGVDDVLMSADLEVFLSAPVVGHVLEAYFSNEWRIGNIEVLDSKVFAGPFTSEPSGPQGFSEYPLNLIDRDLIGEVNRSAYARTPWALKLLIAVEQMETTKADDHLSRSVHDGDVDAHAWRFGSSWEAVASRSAWAIAFGLAVDRKVAHEWMGSGKVAVITLVPCFVNRHPQVQQMMDSLRFTGAIGETVERLIGRDDKHPIDIVSSLKM